MFNSLMSNNLMLVCNLLPETAAVCLNLYMPACNRGRGATASSKVDKTAMCAQQTKDKTDRN